MTAYYVDNTEGNDGNAGTSELAPWKSINPKVNGATFSGADTISFKRGETWTNEELVPGDAGSAGNPITFKDYSTGALPVITDQNNGNCIKIDVAYITIENFRCNIADMVNGNGINVRLAAANNAIIDGCTVIGTSQSENTLEAVRILADNCAVQNCTMQYANKGVNLGPATGVACTIDNNTISGIDCEPFDDADGIKVSADSGHDFTGTTISNNDISGFQEDGIDILNDHNTVIEGNTIHDNGSLYTIANGGAVTGVKLGSGHVVRYNTVYNLNLEDGQGRGIQANNADCKIYYNLVRDCFRAGINVDGNKAAATGTEIYNNTISNIDAEGIEINADANGVTATVQNNICDGGSIDFVVDGAAAVVTGGYNVLKNDGAVTELNSGDYSGDGNDLGSTDPLFVDEAGGDFNLQPTSPCINAGVDVGLDRDYAGVPVPQDIAPDIGSYEYVVGDGLSISKYFRSWKTLGRHKIQSI